MLRSVSCSLKVYVVRRYTLTVWAGQNDMVTMLDFVRYKEDIDISRIYYDLPDM